FAVAVAVVFLSLGRRRLTRRLGRCGRHRRLGDVCGLAFALVVLLALLLSSALVVWGGGGLAWGRRGDSRRGQLTSRGSGGSRGRLRCRLRRSLRQACLCRAATECRRAASRLQAGRPDWLCLLEPPTASRARRRGRDDVHGAL